MLKLFCFLTGDNYTLVSNETPASHKKIMVLGSVMLVPTLMWMVIGYGLSRSFFETGLIVSAIIVLAAAGIIFILERAIVMSGRSVWIAVFRIIIGLVIAILGAIFLDEMIFAKDIEQQQFQERTAVIQSEAGKINASYEPEIQRQQLAVEKLRASWMAVAEEARKEADGTGGSGQRGISGITRLKQNQAVAMKAELEKNEQQLLALVTMRDLALSGKTDEINTNLHGKSILFRVKSLYNLVRKDGVALFMYIVFSVFLFALEFIVIVMKHALPKTNYERRLEAMEVIGNRRIQRIIEISDRSFDPGERNPAVLALNRELDQDAPTLFRKIG